MPVFIKRARRDRVRGAGQRRGRIVTIRTIGGGVVAVYQQHQQTVSLNKSFYFIVLREFADVGMVFADCSSGLRDLAQRPVEIQRYVFYMPPRDVEDRIISMALDIPDKWSGEIKRGNGGIYLIEPQAAPARLPYSVRANRLGGVK